MHNKLKHQEIWHRKKILECIISCNHKMISFHAYNVNLSIKKQYPVYHAWSIIVDIKKKKGILTKEVLKEIVNHLI